MPRVHKKFYCMADPRPLKIQAFKQPHSSCGLDNYHVIDPRSEASTKSSMNSHSPQKQPCRMTFGSVETDLFRHSKILTRGQWILHLRPCSKVDFSIVHEFFALIATGTIICTLRSRNQQNHTYLFPLWHSSLFLDQKIFSHYLYLHE